MRSVILTGGSLDLAFAAAFLKDYSYEVLIAVDGGLEKADALGLIPNAVVGDFDTVDPNILHQYRNYNDILWDVHKPEKDETDTELAFHTALKLGSSHIIMLGGTGGRMDHSLANIQLMYLCLQHRIPVHMLDPQNRIYLLNDSHCFKRSDCWGKYISFIPFSDHIDGLTLEGFRYPLVNRNLQKGLDSGLCVSNELVQEQGYLSLGKGILICIESRD